MIAGPAVLVGWVVGDVAYCVACSPANDETDGAVPVWEDESADEGFDCSVCGEPLLGARQERSERPRTEGGPRCADCGKPPRRVSGDGCACDAGGRKAGT